MRLRDRSGAERRSAVNVTGGDGGCRADGGEREVQRGLRERDGRAEAQRAGTVAVALVLLRRLPG